MNDIDKEINELKNWLSHHSNLYYNGKPEVSDEVYDAKVLELQNLVNTNTLNVGAKPNHLDTSVRHRFLMKSLKNIYLNEKIDLDIIVKWIYNIKKITNNNPDLIFEYKYDGCAISLVYEKGKLVDAVTRGDGEIGESVFDILILNHEANKIPLYIDKFKNIDVIEIKGEVVMPLDEFNRLNNDFSDSDKFLNARNAVSGSLQLKNIDKAKKRRLLFIPYGVGLDDSNLNLLGLYTYKNLMQELNNCGFCSFNSNYICYKFENNDSLDFLHKLLTRALELKRRNQIKIKTDSEDFVEVDSDGVVIKLNEFKYYDLLKGPSHHPDWAVALKFPSITVITKIIDIFTQIGRTGVITPVAMLEPVLLNGVVVSKATLNNEKFITSKCLNIGDKVILRRAGEVIPEIVAKLKHETHESPWKFPKTCSTCGAFLEKAGKIKYKCPNANCSGRLLAATEFAVSRLCLNISGAGPVVLKELFKYGKIKNFVDLFLLTKEDLTECFSDKISNKLYFSIQSAKTIAFSKLIVALGMDLLGKKASGILLNIFIESKFNSLNSLGSISKDDCENKGFGKMFFKLYFPDDSLFFQIPSSVENIYKELIRLENEGVIKIDYRN